MTADKQTMKEVSHTPPSGAPVTNVWQRGREPETAEEPRPADD
ncbi:hypothetical protein ACFQE1_19305 [Halobium palmae]|uniref:Uncharacterized protein n=1 Tax=Halobium palmae TaxID=1776492 RepID=A0ABD5S482_9EURY